MSHRPLRVGAWFALAALIVQTLALPLARAADDNLPAPDPIFRVQTGTVVLNEILSSFSQQPTEFVELYNTGTSLVNISGWTIANRSGILVTFPTETKITVGGFVLAAINDALTDDTDQVTLKDPGGAIMDQLSYGFAATDQIGPAGTDLSLARRADGGAWYGQLSPTPNATNGAALALQPPTGVLVRAGTTNAAHVINAASAANVTLQASVGASSTSNDVVLFDLIDQEGSIASAFATAPIGAGTVFSPSIDTVDQQPLVDGPIVTRTFIFTNAGIETSYSYGTTAGRDTLVPTAPASAQIAASANNPSNVINAATTSTVSVLVTIPATSNASETVIVTLSGSGTVTGNAPSLTGGGNVTVGGLNATTLPEGNLTLTAKVTDAAGNTSPVTTGALIVKDTAAPVASVQINGGATVTATNSVNLALTASDVGGTVTQMRVANTNDFAGSAFEALVAAKTWNLLAGEGSRTVFFQVKDSNGNLSATAQAAIFVETSTQSIDLVPLVPGTQTVRRLPLELTATANQATPITFASYSTNPGTSLPGGSTGLGRFFELGASEPTKLNFPVVIKLYYTLADLTAAGITSESQLQGIAFFDTASQTWQFYSSTGVSTADLVVDGQAFAGFLYANADHLTPLTALADTTAPVAPASLTATPGDGQVALSWPRVADAASYLVRYRVAGSSAAYTMVSLGKDTLATTIVNLANGTRYEFGVAAIDASGNVSAFTTQTATPVAPAAVPLARPVTVLAPRDGKASAAGNGEPSTPPAPAATSTPAPTSPADSDGDGIPDSDETAPGGDTATDQGRDLSRLLVTLAILIIAIGAGTAGYYGYQWWATRAETPTPAAAKPPVALAPPAAVRVTPPIPPDEPAAPPGPPPVAPVPPTAPTHPPGPTDRTAATPAAEAPPPGAVPAPESPPDEPPKRW